MVTAKAPHLAQRPVAGAPFALRHSPRIPLVALGASLSLFLAITYTLCVAFGLFFPEHAMYSAWLRLLPGVNWLTWQSYLLGLVESVAYGWYAALIFGPLFNWFASRSSS